MPTPRLLFVYNADSGLLHGFQDLVHKTLAPETYACALCAITYGLTGMRPAWKQAVRALPLPTGFWHREEFIRSYPAMREQALPAAFREDAAGHVSLFISAAEMRSLTLESLITLVQERVKTVLPAP